MPQIVHPGTNSIARLLQPSRATDIAEALVGAADWPAALVNEEGWDLGFLEKGIPTRLIPNQGFYRRGMQRDDPRLAELALPDCYQSFGQVHVAVCEPNRFAAAHAGCCQQSDQMVIRMAAKFLR